MKYTLYISGNCETCRRILRILGNDLPDVSVVNIDLPKNNPPADLLIIPALFREDKLLAYGGDIPEYIRNAA